MDIKFNSKELQDTIKETDAMLKDPYILLDKISEDIRNLEAYLSKINIDAGIIVLEENIDEDLRISYSLEWSKPREDLDRRIMVGIIHDCKIKGFTEHKMPLIESKMQVRLKLNRFLPELVKDVAERMKNFTGNYK